MGGVHIKEDQIFFIHRTGTAIDYSNLNALSSSKRIKHEICKNGILCILVGRHLVKSYLRCVQVYISII